MTGYQWMCKSCGFTFWENRDYVMHRRTTGHDRTFEDMDVGPMNESMHSPTHPPDERTLEELRAAAGKKIGRSLPFRDAGES